MIEQQIQELKDSLREVLMMISERGQPVNEDMRLMIVRVMEHVANRIQELRTQEQGQGAPIPPAPPTEHLTPGPFPSSSVNAFDYNDQTGELKVKFHGKDEADAGPTYAYSGVPRFIYDIFRRGAVPPRTSGRNRWHSWTKNRMPSLGAAMYHLIRTNYPYQRVA
jgi:hypothetical protein